MCRTVLAMRSTVSEGSAATKAGCHSTLRQDPDVIHLDDCPRSCKKRCVRRPGRPVEHTDGCPGFCKGCRPIPDR